MNLTLLNTCKHCRRFEHNRSVQTMSLTSACWVHSNVYGLGNVHWIRYHTAVDPIHSTSFTMQKYHHLTSGSVEIPLSTSAGNSSSIGKVPVPHCRPIFTSIRATSSEVSHTAQGIIPPTNVLQGHTTVVLVCCTTEWEPDITCTWECCNVCCCIKWKYLHTHLRGYLLWQHSYFLQQWHVTMTCIILTQSETGWH